MLSASQLAELRAGSLMEKIRTLGRLPRTNKKYGEERALDKQLRRAKKAKLLSASQLAELAQLPRTEPRDASQLASERMNTLMVEIRSLGHIPRGNNSLSHRLRYAKRKRQLSESQLAELAELPCKRMRAGGASSIQR